MMGQWLRRKHSTRDAAARLYGAAAAKARDPAFFESAGVPDTFDGRFDLLCLHCALIVIRLKAEDTSSASKLAQSVFDIMFAKNDETLREMGVGDLGVPRHMKKMMEAFNGRMRAYDTALNTGDPETIRFALVNNLYRGIGSPQTAEMSDYTQKTFRHLLETPYAVLSQGTVSFPRFDDHNHSEEPFHA